MTRIEAARYLDAPPTNDAPVVLRDVALKRISPGCDDEDCREERQHTDPADNAYITVTINRKQVEFGQGVEPELIRRSVDLLASCIYMSQKLRWDEIVEGPRAIGGAAKQSYLRVVFENPRAIEVPRAKFAQSR